MDTISEFWSGAQDVADRVDLGALAAGSRISWSSA